MVETTREFLLSAVSIKIKTNALLNTFSKR